MKFLKWCKLPKLPVLTILTRGSQTFPGVPVFLHRQILVPKLLHFFKKVTTLFEKVTTFYLMIFLKIQKLLYFSKSRVHCTRGFEGRGSSINLNILTLSIYSTPNLLRYFLCRILFSLTMYIWRDCRVHVMIAICASLFK